MSYGPKGPATHRSLNGAFGSPLMNNGEQADEVSNSQPTGIRNIDPDILKNRLYSYAPTQAPVNTRALR